MLGYRMSTELVWGVFLFRRNTMESLKELSLEQIARRYCTMGGYTSCNRDNFYNRAKQYWTEHRLDVAIAEVNKKLEAQYPQGWRYYPGDICKHGTYVGGDFDCACPACELGE